MNPEQFERIEQIFEEAILLPPADRIAFVRNRAGNDGEVLRKLEGMLESDARSVGPMDRPVLGRSFSVDEPDAFESRLREEFSGNHRFAIIDKIGEGGFGAVYRAEQREPVKRLLALKVIKLGMDTRRVVARFEAERQALAVMDHPSIARVYEAGATATGRPYFAMELVDGLPITQYLDEKRASIRERLELFVRVCHAVQHAHQKGIIHRDIKPRNVLVAEHDGIPLPKVIDFGIARAVVDEAAGVTMVSEEGQPVGTPAYMSPEQAAGDVDIDTRTDVYSLGVLLYELLTGGPTLPRDVISKASPAQIIRLVRENNAQRPSQRAGDTSSNPASNEIAKLRQEQPRTLARRLRGDLDWILLCALEHDRSRRYESVGAFAEDVVRHLSNEPIRAHPPTATYRLRKFARRNRPAIAVGVLIIVALVGTSIGLFQSVRAERRARTEAQIASAVNAFLNDDLLAAVSPEEMGRDVAMKDVLDAASRRIEGRFTNQPEVEAAIRVTLGRTLMKLAEFDDSRKHLSRAHELRLKLFGERDARTLEAVHELGLLEYMTEGYIRSGELFRQAYEGRTQLLGPDHADTLASQYWLAIIFGELGKFEECEPLMITVRDRARLALGASAPQTLTITRGLALLYLSWQKADQALPLLEEAYAGSRATLGVNNDATLLVMTDLARLLMDTGKPARSIELLDECLVASRSLRGEAHPATLMIMGNLGWAYQLTSQSDRAIQMTDDAITLARAVLPKDNSVTMRLVMSMGEIFDERGEFDRAEKMHLEAVTSLRERFGDENPLTQIAMRVYEDHKVRAARARESIKQPESAGP
jgi:serine/threonine protein kinase/tetratricopeptide (TPR) repeat protein